MALRSKKVVAEQPPLDPNLKWLLVEEAARYLRVSPQYIRGVIHAGELKAAKFGQGYRLDRADLDLFLKTFRRTKETRTPGCQRATPQTASERQRHDLFNRSPVARGRNEGGEKLV